MQVRSKVVTLAFLAVLVPLGFLLAREYLQFDLGFKVQPDQLDYVEVVDQGRPNAAVPTALLEELRAETGAAWKLRLLQDWDPQLGGDPYEGNRKGRAELAAAVTLPDLQDHRVIGAATNTIDPSVVARDGALYLLWFSTPAGAEEWLRSDPDVFVEDDVEDRRTTYWAGSFVVYYAPPVDGTDWSAKVLTSVREFAGL